MQVGRMREGGRRAEHQRRRLEGGWCRPTLGLRTMCFDGKVAQELHGRKAGAVDFNRGGRRAKLQRVRHHTRHDGRRRRVVEGERHSEGHEPVG